jgi:hypothetical protein
MEQEALESLFFGVEQCVGVMRDEQLFTTSMSGWQEEPLAGDGLDHRWLGFPGHLHSVCQIACRL